LERFGAPVSRSIPTIIRSFKAATTKKINDVHNTPGTTVWQRGYHDRVIRNDRELQAVRLYIADNPGKWFIDDENPEHSSVYQRTTFCRDTACRVQNPSTPIATQE
jgi:putative transposase